MELIYCPNCGKPSGFKRALGFGTLFMVVITFGLWLLVIPLYPARCISCGLTRSSAFLENLRTNPRRAITVSSVIAGLVMMLLAYTWLLNLVSKKHAAPVVQGGFESEPSSQSTRSAEPQDHELRLTPDLSGTGAIEDGRTYSVALIVGTRDVLLGTQLFVQGKVERFGYAGMRSRVFAVLSDEQQPDKNLLCAMKEDESAEVLSLYHVGEAVQATGEYMGNMSIAANPVMPVLSDCRVAGPQDNVVRPVMDEITSRASAPTRAVATQARASDAHTPKTASSSNSSPDWHASVGEVGLKNIKQRLFGQRASEFEKYTDERGYLRGDVAVIQFCQPDSCDDKGGILAVEVSDHRASGRAAGVLYDEMEVTVYLGDYAYKENLPSELRAWLENENWSERRTGRYKNIRYVYQ